MTPDPNHPQPSAPLEQPPSTPMDVASPVPLLDARPEAASVIPRRKSLAREYAEAFFVAIFLAVAIKVFIIQAFKIPSGSMIPTLLIGDHILVSEISYGIQWGKDCHLRLALMPIRCYTFTTLIRFNDPRRGDVIVFRYPEDEEKDFIKRIVGRPGDTIEIRDKVVHVNDAPVPDQSYTQRVDPGLLDHTISPRDNFGPITVPEGSYFVMGDNRDQSLDSRFWGYVRAEKIVGKALRIYWSLSDQGPWYEWIRWKRIGKAIE